MRPSFPTLTLRRDKSGRITFLQVHVPPTVQALIVTGLLKVLGWW